MIGLRGVLRIGNGDSMIQIGRAGDKETGRILRSPILPLSRSPALAAVFIVASFAALPAARAHNPDTSYARFAISRTEFAAGFRYDITSLIRIVPKLDADGDHRLTRDELARAVPTIADFLRKKVELEINDADADFGELQPVAFPPDHGDAIAEKDYHAATALVTFDFRKPLTAPPTSFWVRFDLFEQLGLQHTVLGAIHHENQDDEVLFNPFEPDYYFVTTYGEVQPTPSLYRRLLQYFRHGVTHILEGYDHILFLLSLIIVSKFRELVKIVTAFTVAHSITLALAALHYVELPSKWVETAIAATIVFTALENFWLADTSGRWKIAFAFGLIHGFGFANVLGGLDLQTEGFVRALLAFNLGVEVGQLAIVAALALPAALIARSPNGKIVQRIISAAIALCGLGWFVARAFGLDFMPF